MDTRKVISYMKENNEEPLFEPKFEIGDQVVIKGQPHTILTISSVCDNEVKVIGYNNVGEIYETGFLYEDVFEKHVNIIKKDNHVICWGCMNFRGYSDDKCKGGIELKTIPRDAVSCVKFKPED